MKTTMTGLLAMAALAYGGDNGREDAVRKLATMKITVDFQDVKLSEAMDYLRDVTGLNLVLMPRAAEQAGDFKVRLKARDLTVKSTLKLILSGKNLAATYRDGALLILPQEDLQEAVVMEMYDVRAQLMSLQDFPGPRMELVSPKQGSGPSSILTGIELLEPQPPPVPPDFLVELVKDNTGGRAWENKNATITLQNGLLLVSQTPGVHREIKALLGKLAQYR